MPHNTLTTGRTPATRRRLTTRALTVRRRLTVAAIGLALTAAPGAAVAEPTKPPRRVVDGPDIAAGARNAPGGDALTNLINTLGFYAIIACLIGLLLSGLILAIGPRLGFSQASTIGKLGILSSLGVAFLVGISATLVNFAYNAGV